MKAAIWKFQTTEPVIAVELERNEKGLKIFLDYWHKSGRSSKSKEGLTEDFYDLSNFPSINVKTGIPYTLRERYITNKFELPDILETMYDL